MLLGFIEVACTLAKDDSWTSILTAWIGSLTAVFGVLFGLITLRQSLQQRRSEQQWKRIEFVAKEIKEFFGVPAVQTAMWLIDYSELFLLPNGSRPREADPKAWRITDATMISALRNHREFTDNTESFDTAEMLCREAFDAWLTGLESLAHHLETGLISESDLRPHLRYWIDKMCLPDPRWKDLNFYRSLSKFISAYGYSGVRDLCRRFGHDISPEAIDAACVAAADRAGRR